MLKKIVLAYSGGLDTSVIIPWLKENYGCRVIAFIGDVGQDDDFSLLKKKAVSSGADKAVVMDLKKEFVEDYCFPALRAGALYEGRYLLGTALARPILAKYQVEVARREKADSLSHGATGKGNDQVRFEFTYQALAPDLKVVAPWREWELGSREDEIAYARKKGISVPTTRKKPYSMDSNLWHTSYEGGILEDPWASPPEDMFMTTRDPLKAKNSPVYVNIEFKKGNPVALNGRRMSSVNLLRRLNRIAGECGVGRVDIVENRLVGLKSRGVYETPAGTVLHAAHKDLESITLERDVAHHKELVASRYAELVYYGFWFSPLKKAFDAWIDQTQEYVNGTVRLRLYKGSVSVTGRRSKDSLYRQGMVTFEASELWRQADSDGFIKLFGLPVKTEALRKRDIRRKR